MRLLIIALPCFLSANIAEIRFVGKPGDREKDLEFSIECMHELLPRLSEEITLTLGSNQGKGAAERVTLYINGDENALDAHVKNILYELDQVRQQSENNELAGWLAALLKETIPAIEYYPHERQSQEIVQSIGPFRGGKEHTIEVLEQLGYEEEDRERYDVLYNELLTPGIKDHITFIVTTLGNDSLLSLGFKRAELDRRGEFLKHLHPLVFFGYIVSTPSLLTPFQKIVDRTFVWSEWVQGFVGNMQRYALADNLRAYYPGFCVRTASNPVEIERYIRNEEYEQLMRHFAK